MFERMEKSIKKQTLEVFVIVLIYTIGLGFFIPPSIYDRPVTSSKLIRLLF